MNKRILILFIFLLSGLWKPFLFTAAAQDKIIFNPNFNHFLTNTGSYNPAAYEVDYLNSGVFYKSGLGSFSRFRDIYAEAVLSQENHLTGINFFAEQQSVLFSKSKIQGIYAYEVELKEKLSLIFGAEASWVNIRFDGSTASAGGSDWGFDLSTGTFLKSELWNLGVVIQQIPQTILQPIGYEFVLLRYIDLHGSVSIQLNDDLNWETGGLLSVNTDSQLWQWDNKLDYQNKYGVLLSIQNQGKLSAGAYSSIPAISEETQIALSYETGFISSAISRNSFQILFIYRI